MADFYEELKTNAFTWIVFDSKNDLHKISNFLVSRGYWFVHNPSPKLTLIISSTVNLQELQHKLPEAHFQLEHANVPVLVKKFWTVKTKEKHHVEHKNIETAVDGN